MKYICILSFLLFYSSCLVTNEKYSKLTPGIWRAELFLEEANAPISDVSKVESTKDVISSNVFTEGVLPFNFEVLYDGNDQMIIKIMNDSNRIIIDSIPYGRNKSTARDTIIIPFVEFNTYIKAQVDDGIMTGQFIIPRKNISIPFRAIAGKAHRFTLLKKMPTLDLSGRWKAIIGTENPDTTIAEFIQKGNHIKGTFLTTTGDYGFLEGTIQGDRLYLSSFDGSHAFLFQAKITDNQKLTGIFLSGKSNQTTWVAEKNDHYKLPNAYKLSQKTSNEALSFSLLTSDSTLLNFKSVSGNNRFKLIQIMGTWCPNCKDEATFLTEFLSTHKKLPIDIYGVSFESFQDTSTVIALLKKYKSKMKIPYTLLWGGKADRIFAQSLFPMINKILAFPTLILLNPHNQIIDVHTGFSGPATSEYAAFKKEFETKLLKLSE